MGFDDPRAAPLAAILNMLTFARALVVILERVLAFMQHKGVIQPWFTKTLELLAQRGYRVSHRVEKGAEYTPQHRDRLFIGL